jgi:riboflavin biosynthesis pyrimidine reductase
MAKFLYSAAMSLDGFIAGPDGDMSWMTDFLGPNPVVDDLISQTGALLVGNRTFGGDDPTRVRRVRERLSVAVGKGPSSS